jgi:hypothetical protein
MKKAIKMKFRMKNLFMAVTLVSLLLLGFAPAQVGAVTCSTSMANNTTDTDLDGFTDWQECNWNGQTTSIDTKTKIYGQLYCPGTGNNPACTSGYTCHCLDPNKKDLFVIIVNPSTGSLFPPNPLQNISAPITQGGLGIAVHPIKKTAPYTNSSRFVVGLGPQKAVMLTESPDMTSMDVLGISNTGTPNDLDNTTIYTSRIKKFVTDTCGSNNYNTSKCADSTSTSVFGDALLQKYILHTIAHEIGHVLGPLSPIYDPNYGGNHYKSGTNVIMDQSVYYTKSGDQTTFYIGTGYTASDQSSAKLKK